MTGSSGGRWGRNSPEYNIGLGVVMLACCLGYSVALAKTWFSLVYLVIAVFTFLLGTGCLVNAAVLRRKRSRRS